MTSASLNGFNERLNAYVKELEQLRIRNAQDHAFQPTFWLRHADFTLARDVFVAASGSIGHEVTKFSLVYSKSPSQEDATSVCNLLEKPCEQLLAATKVALFSGAGPSLAEDIINNALRVMNSVRDLGACIANEQKARISELTGRVWEVCESIKNISKSNCIASKRSMLQCVSVLNDTIKELREFLSEAPTEVQEIEWDDEYAFDSTLTDDDRVVFEGGLRLLEMVVSILKRGILTLKNSIIDDGDQELVKWTASLDRLYKVVQETVVDMGAAFYPPIAMDELCPVLTRVEHSTIAVLDCLNGQPGLSVEEQVALSKGRTAFSTQVRTVHMQIET